MKAPLPLLPVFSDLMVGRPQTGDRVGRVWRLLPRGSKPPGTSWPGQGRRHLQPLPSLGPSASDAQDKQMHEVFRPLLIHTRHRHPEERAARVQPGPAPTAALSWLTAHLARRLRNPAQGRACHPGGIQADGCSHLLTRLSHFRKIMLERDQRSRAFLKSAGPPWARHSQRGHESPPA